MSLRDHLEGRGGRGGMSTGTMAKIVTASVVLVGIIATSVWLYVLGTERYVSTDQNTLCPVDQRQISEALVILLDMSDRFSLPQKLKVRNELQAVKRGVGRFGLIEVYAVDRSDSERPKAVLTLCNPGTGDQMNGLYQNPALAQKRWDEFSGRLDQEVENLMDSPSSPTSPIMEAIQSTALRTFGTLPAQVQRRSLVVVSDLVQNVPGCLSQFDQNGAVSEIVPFEAFRRSDCFTKVRTNDLRNVSATLLYLVRSPQQKWPEHRQFWEEYFSAEGARVDRIEPVFGGQANDLAAPQSVGAGRGRQ
jgi:hypothetical protein